MERINVIRSSMPPIEEYVEEIRDIWDSRWLTNAGPKHQVLTEQLSAMFGGVGASGEVYNIGGNNEKANIEIVRLILRELDKPQSLIVHVQDRPGHDRRYAIDNGKITSELGWHPTYTFEEGIVRTIHWYLENQEWLEHVTSGIYADYYKKMYGMQQID